MSSFLISGAVGILKGYDDADARTEGGSVRVEDGIVTAIGAVTPRADERVVDASGAVVTPGLINTHHHLFQSVMKAVPPFRAPSTPTRSPPLRRSRWTAFWPRSKTYSIAMPILVQSRCARSRWPRPHRRSMCARRN